MSVSSMLLCTKLTFSQLILESCVDVVEYDIYWD